MLEFSRRNRIPGTEVVLSLPAIKGQIRAALLSVPIGLLVFVGGGAAVALGERGLGGTLIALGILCPVTGMIILLRVKRAAVTAATRARLSVIDEFLRDKTEGKDGP
jgi:hypothetical protein